MSMEYIRSYYSVPAKLGGRVKYTGDRKGEKSGTIRGARGAHLEIQMDGEPHAGSYHPTWEIEYLEQS